MTQLTKEIVTDPNHELLNQALDTQDSELEKLRQQRDALTVQIEIKEKAKRDEVLLSSLRIREFWNSYERILSSPISAA
jgi:HAMP domain-containing protein